MARVAFGDDRYTTCNHGYKGSTPATPLRTMVTRLIPVTPLLTMVNYKGVTFDHGYKGVTPVTPRGRPPQSPVTMLLSGFNIQVVGDESSPRVH